MSSSFKSRESKQTKPLRLFLCFNFVIEILLLAMPYIATVENNTYYSKTIVQIIIGMINSGDIKWIKLGMLAIIFSAIPVAGFFIAAFDKEGLVKCFAGCICSFLGICCILFAIPQFSTVLAFGAMAALIVYLLIFALSVSLALKTLGVRALQRQEEQLAKEHNEA